MRLSARDQTILLHATLHADESIPELARRCKQPAHTVRYVLGELERRGTIRKRWVVDLMACGWGRYEIFFSVATGNRKIRQTLVSWLKDNILCTYLAEVGGEFDYELILIAKSSQQVKDILAELTEKCGEISFTKVVAHHNQVHYFPRKYLSSSNTKPSVMSMGNTEKSYTLKDLDHQILSRLAQDPNISQREIARQCGCMPLTVTRHMEELKRARVLIGAMYSLNGSKIGAQNYILLIYSRGFHRDLTEKLFKFCLHHPHVTNMKECFGSWDFEVGVEALENSNLRDVKEQLLELFAQQIEKITLLSRFSNLKYELYPFR